LEVALTRGESMDSVGNNGLESTWEVLLGDVLRLPVK
jgi:hypothetical protein